MPGKLQIPLLATCTFIFLAVPAFPITPPVLPPNLLPQQQPPPAPPHPILSGRPVQLTPSLVYEMGLSSTVQDDILRVMAGASRVSSNSLSTTSPSQPAEPLSRSSARTKRFIVPDTTGQGAVAVMTDSNADLEPAIITNRFVENGSTVDRTTIAFTKLDASLAPQHWWGSTTNDSTFTTGMLAPLYPDSRTSDPMIAENPFVSAGDFAKRTYISGTSYNVDGGGTPGHVSLMVWWRDNFTTDTQWHPQIVDQANNPNFFDKPSIWVSWEQGSIGYVYIVAILVYTNPPNPTTHTLYVYRGKKNDFGQLQFTLVNFSITGNSQEIRSPIITVGNGSVWLLWMDYLNRRIRIARSTDLGASFVNQADLAIGVPYQSAATLCDSANHCVRSSSNIMARPTVAAGNNHIGVAWHQQEPTPQRRADIYFDAFSMDSLAWLSATPQHVSEGPINDGFDQWNPAVEPVGDGTYMIAWYDKRNDSANEFYRVYATKLYPWGQRVDPSDTLIYNSAVAADIANVPAIPQPPPLDPIRLMGEYQDLWEWFGTFHGGTIYVTSTEDAYVSRILP